MKRLLTLTLTILVTALGATGQVPGQPSNKAAKKTTDNQAVHHKVPFSQKATPYFAKDNQPTKRPPATEPFSASYNIEGLINSALPSQSNRAITAIHVDSALLEFTDGFIGTFFHSSGMVFNPGEGLIDRLSGDLPTLNYFNSYNLDSVSFPYWYNRPIDSFVFRDTFTSDSMAVDFRVNGMFQDTFKYSFTPTKRFTNTDTTELKKRVTFFRDMNNPFVITKDTTFYPAYNIYDTFTNSNKVDTQMLMPDSILVNSKQQRTIIDSVSEDKQEVVDTLVFQYYIVRQNYVSWGETEEGPFTGDTILTASVPSINRKAEMSQPDGEVRIPLRSEDEFNFNNNNNSTDVTIATDLEVPAATEQLGEPISVAAAVTFKPGYPVNGRDTLRVLDDDDNSLFKNNFIYTVQNVFSGLLANESYTNAITTLSSQRYGSSDLADFFEDNYFMLNAPPTETPGPNNNASTARYFPFTFHISADETDNLDSNRNVSTKSVLQPDPADQNIRADIYPNPTVQGENVQVKLQSHRNADVQVRLYNTIGKMVRNKGTYQITAGQGTSLQIQTRELEPGVYFLNIQTPQGERTKKLSITR